MLLGSLNGFLYSYRLSSSVPICLQVTAFSDAALGCLLILSPQFTTLLNRTEPEIWRRLAGFVILLTNTFVWVNLSGFELCRHKSKLLSSFLFSITGPKHYKSVRIPLSGRICLCVVLTGALVCGWKTLSPPDIST